MRGEVRGRNATLGKEKPHCFLALLELLTQAQQMIERAFAMSPKAIRHMSEIPPFPKPHLIRKGPLW